MLGSQHAAEAIAAQGCCCQAGMLEGAVLLQVQEFEQAIVLTHNLLQKHQQQSFNGLLAVGEQMQHLWEQAVLLHWPVSLAKCHVNSKMYRCCAVLTHNLLQKQQ